MRRSSFSRREPRPSGLRRGLAGLLLLSAPLWVVALRQLVPQLLGATTVGPDVLAAALAVAAWNHRPASAVAFAALTGWLLDVPSGLPWGIGAARTAVLVAGLASLRRARALELPGARFVLLGVFGLVERLSAALALKLVWPEVDLEPLLIRGGWIALATLPLAPLAFSVSGGLCAEAGCEVAR